MYAVLKRVFVGRPIATSEEHHTRLPKKVALPVFASDAISSTAYATQEILIVLIPAVGLAATDYLVPLALVVCVLLAIVITSYRQTIMAYPGGGGTYIVSRENLGPRIRRSFAGASILVDYVLTVAVSVSAGVAAITSAFPDLAAVPRGPLPRLRGPDDDGQPAGPQGVGHPVRSPRPTSTSSVLFVMIAFGLYRSLHRRSRLRSPPDVAHRRDHRTGRHSPASAS